MVDRKALQNLNIQDQIVEFPGGTPTQFFMRLLQGKTDLTTDIETEVTDLRSIVIDTDAPISGGPYAFADHVDGDPPLVISHDDSGVTPDTYGDGTHVPQFTVDEKGHITGVTEVPISGGGGAPWYFLPPAAAIFTTHNESDGGAANTLTDDADIGLRMVAGSYAGGGDRSRRNTLPVPGAAAWVWTVRYADMLQNYNCNYQSTGICLVDTVASRMVNFVIRANGGQPNGAIAVDYWNGNGSSYGGSTFSEYPGNWIGPIWFRIELAAGNLIYSYSINGKDFRVLLTTAETAWLTNTPDLMGLVFSGNNTSSPEFHIATVDYWSVV